MADICGCQEQRRIDRLIKNSGLTPAQRKVTLAQFRPDRNTRPMFNVVKSYLANFDAITSGQGCDKGFGLTGSFGAGKTHMALAVTNELLKRRISVVYVTTPDLMAELRAAQFSDGGQEMENKITLLKEAAVVIFDDLAREPVTEWVQNQYFRVVNGRYCKHLPTCFTSNWDQNGIAERVGDASASRLYAMTQRRLVPVDAPDYRIKATE